MVRSASKAAAPDWAQTAEQQVLDAALKIVAEEGWTSRLATLAGRACGLSAGETELLLPHGAADLAALLWRRHDGAAMAELGGIDPGALKIRERIARGVEAWLNAACADQTAVRRLTGFLALPPNLTLGARLTWESADRLWRWAGDTATDENHYSKRALLAGILSGALAIRLSSGPAAALAFTDRRIANVMAFETWKRTTKFRPSKFLDEAAAALGRIRFGSSPP